MFSKAPIKRFNDRVTDTPGPDAYDVKELGPKGSGVAVVKSDRFVTPKDITPGPGQYDVEAAKNAAAARVRQSLLKRQSSFKGAAVSSKSGSKTSSTSSLYTEVDEGVSFKTPSKRNVPSFEEHKLKQKYEQVCLQLTSATEELAKYKRETESIRQNLENRISELESGVRSKESELSDKLSEIERLSEERNAAESKIASLDNELEEIRCRELTLSKELEMLNQDNLTLEEKIDESTKALLEEKLALEEKSTFLHFTQEQLNHQVVTLEAEVAKLKSQIEELQMKLAESEKELVSEKSKLSEFTEMYVKENQDTETEFGRLQEEIETLKQQSQNTDEIRTQLESKIIELEESIKILTDEKEELKSKLDEASQDLEVFENDREVLESERKRLEREKTDLGLDLMSVTSEKMTLEKKMFEMENEKSYLLNQVKDLLDEKSRIEETCRISKEDQARIDSQLVELRDVAMKQKISLDGKEQIIGDLQSEIEELEMKNSSLEGSLCATQNEVSNLEAENKALFCSFEKVEETVRGYIHRCQDLEIQIQELTSAKDDLNQTCLILEARMKQAVQAYEGKVRDCEHVTTTLKETENFAEKLKNDIASLESKNANLHELMEIAKQTNATNEEIAEQNAANLRRKVSELEERLFASFEQIEKLNLDFESVRGEHTQLLDLNKVLSLQVSEGLSTTQKLTQREEELNRRLEKAQHELDLVHQGMNLELNQRWEAEDELLMLKEEIDQVNAILQESNEQIKILRDQVQESEIDYDQVKAAKNNLEVKFSNLKFENDKNVQDHSMFQQEQDELSSRLAKEIDVRSSLEKKLKLAEEAKEIMKDQLDLYEEEISSLKLSLEAQQALIAESEAKIEALEDDMDAAERMLARSKEMESMLEEYMNEVKELENKEAEFQEMCRDKDELIKQLRLELDPLQEESQTYKEKYEALQAMIEPFKDQLESYEMEKAALLSQNQEAKGEVKKLASQYAQLLGHQNHKQKIQHLVRVKEENVAMREQIAKLQLENAKQKRTIARLETDSTMMQSFNRTTTASRRFDATQVEDKENDESVFYTPMPEPRGKKPLVGKIPFAASTPHLRRQTIASPLSSRNGP